jgi:hypothetical protein
MPDFQPVSDQEILTALSRDGVVKSSLQGAQTRRIAERILRSRALTFSNTAVASRFHRHVYGRLNTMAAAGKIRKNERLSYQGGFAWWEPLPCA